ncbi:MAG: hypothetical protein ACFFBI_00370 [Promethearchaeota archaeon]
MISIQWLRLVKIYKLRNALFIISLLIVSQLLVFAPSYKNSIFNEYNNCESRNLKRSIKFEWNSTSVGSSGRDIGKDNKNNIYITGYKYNTSKETSNIILVKYSSSGSLEWNKTWGGIDNDIGNALCLDSRNNIYITGVTRSLGDNNGDLALIKYNESGELEWNRTWGGDQLEVGYDLTTDKSENIYVIGYTESYGLLGDIILLKFNSSGVLLWNKTWGGGDTDLGYAISVDSDENVYFTGYTSSFEAETSDLLLVKSNKEGNIQWNITWGDTFPDEGRDLAIDSSNNIFVVGTTQNYGAGSNDFVLLKFNSSGNLIWNTTWGGSENEYAYSIALNSKEYIYVVGYTTSFNGNDKDVAVIKFNETGNIEWFKTWGNEFEECAYGITINSLDNLCITGDRDGFGNRDYLIFLAFSPVPDYFELSSDALTPDPDGNFTLAWGTSLDADYYALYQYNKTINKINSSITELINTTYNRTCSLTELDEGIYFFLVSAFNEYGNTSSNCKKIKVQFPPQGFILNNNSEIPDVDGIINLTWSSSKGAKNYSVYVHDEYFTTFETTGTLVKGGLIGNHYQLENFTNGDYYIIVVALNEAGYYVSNCILIIVRRAPTFFTLSSDANEPDLDGNFTLVWAKSEFAQYYTLYFINQSDFEANESIQMLYNFTPSFEWPFYEYRVFGWNNGTYKLQIIAFNEFGNSSTEWITIIISIPKDKPIDNDDTNNTFKFPTYLFSYLTFFCLLGLLIFIYMKRKRKL